MVLGQLTRPGVMRVEFVYANPRRTLAQAVRAGAAPDTGLLGQNHLADYGIAAGIHDSRMRRSTHLPGLVHRLTWLARELTAPWEVGRADVIVTPLSTILPLTARLRRYPKVALLNINICTALRRLDGARRRILCASLRSAAAIVCLAEAQRELLLHEVDLDPERVHVALLGVDARFNEPLPEPESARVLAVGRDLGRDYATFATAMRGLDTPATLVASSRNLVGVDLPDNVTVELDVPPPRLRTLYAAASCVVVPTRAREFDQGADCSGQTVLLDSMAMGRATVISRRATLDEYIDDGRTAVVVPPEDPPALREAIEEVLSDDELRRRLGRDGRSRVEQSHTTPLFARRLAEILRSIA